MKHVRKRLRRKKIFVTYRRKGKGHRLPDLPFDHPDFLAAYNQVHAAYENAPIEAPKSRRTKDIFRAAERFDRGYRTTPLNEIMTSNSKSVTRLRDSIWARLTRAAGGCWEWTGSKTRHGYGMVSVQTSQGRKSFRVHRVTFALTFGDPGDRIICHRCNNPKCANPEHLYAGDEHTNFVDAVKAFRQKWDTGSVVSQNTA